MTSTSVHCPECGTNDTLIVGADYARDPDEVLDDVSRPRACERCDHEFTPAACPSCGSYRREGRTGVSGAPHDPLAVTRCGNCGELLVPLDPPSE